MQRVKEARSEVKEQTETLALKDRVFEEAKERLREEAALERTKIMDEWNPLIERSKEVLDKLQTTYHIQVANYEAQANVAAVPIKKLKKEKEAMAEKAKMDIKRIRITFRGQREWLHQRFVENVAVVWEQWSKQAVELQLLYADVENRKRVGDVFYKMDQESMITIQDELT